MVFILPPAPSILEGELRHLSNYDTPSFADLSPTRGDIIKSKNQVAFYDGYKWEGDLTAVIPGLGILLQVRAIKQILKQWKMRLIYLHQSSFMTIFANSK